MEIPKYCRLSAVLEVWRVQRLRRGIWRGALLIAGPWHGANRGTVSASGGTSFGRSIRQRRRGQNHRERQYRDGERQCRARCWDNTGRVRIEANSLSAHIVTTPPTIAVAARHHTHHLPIRHLPGGENHQRGRPARARRSTAPLVSSADIAIQKNTPVTVVLKTYNFATAGAVVGLRIANKFGGIRLR